MDRQTLAARQTADVKILQKVNAAHREAFSLKYPTQVEHCLRLVLERLQFGLDKRDGVDITRVDTWNLTPEQIQSLADAALKLHDIRQDLRNPDSDRQ
jgi:hypothetical protein